MLWKLADAGAVVNMYKVGFTWLTCAVGRIARCSCMGLGCFDMLNVWCAAKCNWKLGQLLCTKYFGPTVAPILVWFHMLLPFTMSSRPSLLSSR